MATLYGVAGQQSPSIVADGATRAVRLDRSGAVITKDWVQAAIEEGRVYGVQTGSGTSPTTFNAAYAAGEQDLYIGVPAGTVIIPLQISLVYEDSGTALAQDVFAAYSNNGTLVATGTALTSYNFKTGDSNASNCSCDAVVTSTGVTHLGGDDFLEFWRPYGGFGEDAFNGSTGWVNNAMHGAHWSAKTMPAPIIGSAGSTGALSVYMGSQAGIGFITVIWAEFPASRFA